MVFNLPVGGAFIQIGFIKKHVFQIGSLPYHFPVYLDLLMVSNGPSRIGFYQLIDQYFSIEAVVHRHFVAASGYFGDLVTKTVSELHSCFLNLVSEFANKNQFNRIFDF